MERRRVPRSAYSVLDAVCELSSTLADTPPDQVHFAITNALQRIADLFAVDHCMLYEIRKDHSVELAYFTGPASFSSHIAGSGLSQSFPWMVKKVVEEGQTLCLNALEDVPVSAQRDRESYRKRKIKSVLLMPLSAKQSTGHVLAIVSTRAERKWTRREAMELRVIGEPLMHALARKKMNEAQRDALEFEQFIAGLSVRFAGVRWDRVADEIDIALREVLEYCHADQVGIFEIFPKTREAYLRHLAHIAGIVPASLTADYGPLFPWKYDKLVVKGELIAMARTNELPPEALIDRFAMAAMGMRSVLNIPVRVDDQVRYVFALGSSQEEHAWPERSLIRLQSLGEVFVNAITRTKAVEALQQSQDSLNEAQHIARLGRWEWDANADTIKSSQDITRIFGADPRSLSALLEIVHPADRTKVQRSIDYAISKPGEQFMLEYVVRRPDGDRIIQQWHEVSVSSDRVTSHFNATIQDVTEWRKTEQELIDLRAHHWHFDRVSRTGVLVASLAHELSQPLAAVLSNAQAGLRFLGQDDVASDEIRNILVDIVAANKRASEVLGALRSMLRRQRTERAHFDIVDAVRDVLGLLRSELTTQQVELETSHSPGCFVFADSTQIEQVLLNLVMNAIDAMDKEPLPQRRLRIAVSREEGGDVRVAVSDSGTGIPKEQFQKVFEAFWTTKGKGMGMGLSVCRAIVESHGGRIWVDSNTDRGVTFYFKLPAAAEPHDSTAQLAEAPARHEIAMKLV